MCGRLGRGALNIGSAILSPCSETQHRVLYEGTLLQAEVEEIICYQVGDKPQKNYNGIGNEASAIFHSCKEWHQKYPKSEVIYCPDN